MGFVTGLGGSAPTVFIGAADDDIDVINGSSFFVGVLVDVVVVLVVVAGVVAVAGLAVEVTGARAGSPLVAFTGVLVLVAVVLVVLRSFTSVASVPSKPGKSPSSFPYKSASTKTQRDARSVSFFTTND
ncbi:hypothetical protein CPB86DRAFT_783866, partial [Serendipita vermifera]